MTADRPTEAEATSASSVARWARMLPVAVLLIAIGAQAILMATVNADRQSGSGFAMFSSVDFAGSRSVVVEASIDGATLEVQLPARLAGDVSDLLVSPTDGEASDLATQLVGVGWRIEDSVATAGGDLTADRMTVTVRGLTADGRQLSAEVLARGSSS